MTTQPEQSIDWPSYVVHLPVPSAFGERAEERAELLANVRYFLVVGSLLRPQRIVQRVQAQELARVRGSYFNLVDDPGIGDREFNVEVLSLDVDGEGVDVAVASHGIGGSGAEIVINELTALIHIARQACGESDQRHLICGVGRSGTRGTLGQAEYGTVGISTASFSDDFDVAHPDTALLRCTLDAAAAGDHPWKTGVGISTDLFWEGQGRVVPSQHGVDIRDTRRTLHAEERLWRWVDRGIEFVEMEDYTVHRACRNLGIPSVSAGAIIARRFDETSGQFVLDYDAAAKKQSELWPAEILLDGFRRHWRWLQAHGGPEAVLTSGSR